MENENNKRRNFLKKTALGGLGGVFLAKTGMAMVNQEKEEQKIIERIRPLGFQWETRDPFLFCVHHEDHFPKGNAEMGPEDVSGRNLGNDFHIKDGWRMYHGRKVPGFPGHPHRGFETVTVVRKGLVDHSDSLGASGRYGNGDVQWMTAGKGLQHAEMFPLLNQEDKNELELFQIWLNLPKKNKFVAPHFKMLWHEDIPKFTVKDANQKEIYIEVLAGTLSGQSAPTPPPNSWAADKTNEVGIWNIKIEANGTYTLPKASEGINRSIYFYKGSELALNETILQHYYAADVRANAEIVLKAIDTEAQILVLQGKPINEPVVQHGPFVMNTRQEIQEAFEEYQQTQFGGWPWSRYDQVHARENGRFAKHSDGRTELKG